MTEALEILEMPEVPLIITEIELISFNYDLLFEPEPGTEVNYAIDILHRISDDLKTVQMLATITYHVKDKEGPVLSTSSLTTFVVDQLEGRLSNHPDNPDPAMRIADPLFIEMSREATAHTRALLSINAARTPYAFVNFSILSKQDLERQENAPE